MSKDCFPTISVIVCIFGPYCEIKDWRLWSTGVYFDNVCCCVFRCLLFCVLLCVCWYQRTKYQRTNEPTNQRTNEPTKKVNQSHFCSVVQNATDCRLQGAISKGKRVVKSKLIGPRFPVELQFLSEMVIFITRSGANWTDELFSVYTLSGSKVALTGRAVGDQIKVTWRRLRLPPNNFSSFSLSKGAKIHLRAIGAPEDDRRDLGNYARGSQVMHSTYDYETGLGPFASYSLPVRKSLPSRINNASYRYHIQHPLPMHRAPGTPFPPIDAIRFWVETVRG